MWEGIGLHLVDIDIRLRVWRENWDGLHGSAGDRGVRVRQGDRSVDVDILPQAVPIQVGSST